MNTLIMIVTIIVLPATTAVDSTSTITTTTTNPSAITTTTTNPSTVTTTTTKLAVTGYAKLELMVPKESQPAAPSSIQRITYSTIVRYTFIIILYKVAICLAGRLINLLKYTYNYPTGIRVGAWFGLGLGG